jgi:putative protease
MSEMKSHGIKAPLHVSTQANTVSPQTVAVLHALGADRVNLARELSLERISTMMPAITSLGIETEVFIHGSVCFSYSGRCAVSDYLTGRLANRGECTHPCRWKYHLVEEKRPGQFMPVLEDERGTYFFNAKDLALFSFVPKLMSLGINSFKLEGRMKSIHYVAQTVSLYRRLLDGEEIDDTEALRLLSRVSNRGYSTGFMKGEIGPDDYRPEQSSPTSVGVFIGNIESRRESGVSVMNIRNKTFAGETVEILNPDGTVETRALPDPLVDIDGVSHAHASHGTLLVLPFLLAPYAIVRRVVDATF